METVEYNNISFAVWDLGGQEKVFGYDSFPTLLPSPAPLNKENIEERESN